MDKTEWTRPRDLKNMKFGLKVHFDLMKGFGRRPDGNDIKLPEIEYFRSLELNLQLKNVVPSNY